MYIVASERFVVSMVQFFCGPGLIRNLLEGLPGPFGFHVEKPLLPAQFSEIATQPKYVVLGGGEFGREELRSIVQPQLSSRLWLAVSSRKGELKALVSSLLESQ